MPEKPHGLEVPVAAVLWFLLSSAAHEWSQPLRARAMDLPGFGQGTSGNTHREDAGEAEQGPRGSGEQGGARESNLPPYTRVKQEDELASPLDDYFCKGMDTSGPAAWAKVLARYGNGRFARGRIA